MTRFRGWIYPALALVLLACLAAPMLQAQTYTNLPTFAKTPEHWMQQALSTNTTASLTIVDCTVTTYGCNNLGTKITSIIATSTDSVSNTLELSINNGTETAILATITIPGFSGDGVGSPVNVLTLGNIPGIAVDSDGNPSLPLTASQKLLMNMSGAVSATKAVTVFVQGPVF